MFRLKTRLLLALGLGVTMLVAVPSVLAAYYFPAQSVVDASCDDGTYVHEESSTGSAGYREPRFAMYANAGTLTLRSASLSTSDSNAFPNCYASTTLWNSVLVEPGSSGLSVGDPVTLELVVDLDGHVSADFRPIGAGPVLPQATSGVGNASLDVFFPDRGNKMLASFDAHALDAASPMGTTGIVEYSTSWDWELSTNRGDARGDHQAWSNTCPWSAGCSAQRPPAILDVSETILVDALVGDRIQFYGTLGAGSQAQLGTGLAAFPDLPDITDPELPAPAPGLKAALTPAAGSEGLRLTFELGGSPPPPPADGPPSCDPVERTTDEDTPVNGTLSCDDESPSTLRYELVAAPAHGQAVVSSDGSYTYTPAENVNGQDSFQVTATDAAGHVSSPATVSVTVDPVNDRPVCVTKSASATVGQTAQLDAECDDADRDPLTIALTAQGTKGTATVDGLTIEYTPTQPGTDSFTYTASDGALTSSPATVTLTNLAPPAALNITVVNGAIVFRNPPVDDRARFAGTLAAQRQALSCASDVTVTLNDSVFAQTVPGSAFRSRNNGTLCVYTRLAAAGTGGILRLELNLATNTFLVRLRDEVNLSRLTNPVTIGLAIGDLRATATIRMKQARARWTYPG